MKARLLLACLGRALSQYCSPGQYNAGSKCPPCPVGQYMPKYNSGGYCWNCEGGLYQNATGATMCFKCPVAKYSPSGSSACLTCPISTFSNTEAQSACSPCAPGTYSNSTGMSVCKVCAIGLYQDVAGQNKCSPCLAGSISSATGTAVCSLCAPGTYANGTGMSACKSCEIGLYQGVAGQNKCSPCLAGSFSSATGTVTCAGCDGGKYTDRTGQTRCLNCTTGTYSTGGAQACLGCAVGTYSTAISASSCVKCAVGKYQSITGMTNCSACIRGKYASVTGASTCITCQSGSYGTTTGAAACKLCDPGTYLASSIGFSFSTVTYKTACDACSIGEYATGYGSTGYSICTQCSPGMFASSACAATYNTKCKPCSVCPDGTMIKGACRQGNSLGLQSQDVVCGGCEECPWGMYVSRGCDGGKVQTVCSNCSKCSGDELVGCTPFSDTICSEVVSCRSNVNYTVYDWITPGETCPRGKYLDGYDQRLNQAVCTTCPEGLWGPNGLWCEFCEGYKLAYFDASMCVCHPSTSPTFGGGCECGPGREFMQDGCVECPENTFNNGTLVLGDDWWDQYMECSMCEAGTFSPAGSTVCVGCGEGTWRLGNDTDGCKNCSIIGEYAADPRDPTSCTACNESCGAGFYSTQCTNDPGLYICHPCGNLPQNGYYMLECDWACNVGFIPTNSSTCERCNDGMLCPPGFNLTVCTDFSQSHCDEPCGDTGMPLFDAHYTTGCTWECDEGYAKRYKDYGLWQEYACVLGAEFDWSE